MGAKSNKGESSTRPGFVAKQGAIASVIVLIAHIGHWHRGVKPPTASLLAMAEGNFRP